MLNSSVQLMLLSQVTEEPSTTDSPSSPVNISLTSSASVTLTALDTERQLGTTSGATGDTAALTSFSGLSQLTSSHSPRSQVVSSPSSLNENAPSLSTASSLEEITHDSSASSLEEISYDSNASSLEEITYDSTASSLEEITYDSTASSLEEITYDNTHASTTFSDIAVTTEFTHDRNPRPERGIATSNPDEENNLSISIQPSVEADALATEENPASFPHVSTTFIDVAMTTASNSQLSSTSDSTTSDLSQSTEAETTTRQSKNDDRNHTAQQTEAPSSAPTPGYDSASIPQQPVEATRHIQACRCVQKDKPAIFTPTKVQQQNAALMVAINEIRANLTIPKNSTGLALRQKISAPDDRPTSAAMGSVAVVCLTLAPLAFVLFDLTRLVVWLRSRFCKASVVEASE